MPHKGLSYNLTLEICHTKDSYTCLNLLPSYRLPDSPAEPDLEPFEPSDPKFIPLEDVSMTLIGDPYLLGNL
jgi:hypothetical protein